MRMSKIFFKKLLVTAICVFNILSLCSCNATGKYEKLDLDQRIIVNAMGIDITKDGKFEVTLQILAQEGAGTNTPIDPSKPNSTTVAQVADTIPAAIERCETDLGKTAFLGHTELVLLGKSVTDLNPVMDYVINAQGISLGIFMAYTDITAKEILDIKVNSGAYSGEALKEVFEESLKNGISTECELIKHIDNIEDTNGTTVMPIIKKIKDPIKSSEEKDNSSSELDFGESNSDGKIEAGNEKLEGGGGDDSSSGGGGSSGGSEKAEQTAFYIDGAVIVKNKKPHSVMTRDEIAGLSFINSSVAKQTFNAKLGDMLTAVNVSSTKKDTKVSIKDNRIVFDIHLTISYEFYINYSEEEQKEAAKDVTEQIYSLCYKAIDKALKQENADIFGIHSLLNHNDYRLYQEYMKNPERVLKLVDININLNPQI